MRAITGAAAAPGARLIAYSVRGVAELNLVVPAEAALVGAPPSAGGAPPSPTSGPTPAAPVPPVAPTGRGGTGRLVTIVRNALAARPARAAIPPLLRDVTEALTRDLLDAIAPEPTSDDARSVRDTLTTAGITSVANLLDAHPEDLHVDVLNRGNATGLAELLAESEKIVATTAKAVGDTIQQFAADGRVVSRDNLQAPAIATEFSDALANALKGAVDLETIAAAVSRASNA
jgi:hypothetical protein